MRPTYCPLTTRHSLFRRRRFGRRPHHFVADNRKAEDIAVLDVADVSSIADYFVIASGTSEPHLRAISDEITEKLREDHGLKPRAVDGTLQAGWLVLDYFDVIVHVMRADVRQHYDLEGLCGDAPRVRPRAKSKPKAARKKATA